VFCFSHYVCTNVDAYIAAPVDVTTGRGALVDALKGVGCPVDLEKDLRVHMGDEFHLSVQVLAGNGEDPIGGETQVEGLTELKFLS
jgi:hypothetical protein